MPRKFNRTLLVAPTGAGKSTLVRQLVSRRTDGLEYIFVTDFHRLYPCRHRFDRPDQMLEFFEGDESPGVYCADFGPVAQNEDAWNDFFQIVDMVSGLSAKRKNRPVTLVVDEIVEFSSSVKMVGCLERFIWYSRLAEIDLYLNTMAPQGLHRLIKINCNRLIVFAQHRRKDLRAIMEDTFLTDRDYQAIRGLSPFHWSEKSRVPVRGRNYLVFESSTSHNRSGLIDGGSPRERYSPPEPEDDPPRD